MSDNLSRIKRSSQAIDNFSFDEGNLVKVVLPLEVDPAGGVLKKVTGNLALQYVVDGTKIYVGEATIGALTSEAVWRVFKFDSSTGAITWANGSPNFENLFSNPSSLSYS